MWMVDAMTQTPKYPAVTCIRETSCVNDCKKCSNSFFAIFLQHVTLMNICSSIDAAIIVQVVTPVCLFI